MSNLDELLSLDHLATAYRRRRPLSPVEVTDYFLDRIARHDPTIQSIVTVTAEQARRQARAAERRLAAGDPDPLLGVPLLLKDLIDVKGVPTTAGSAVRRDHIASGSAALWTRLQRCGAVLLGKANTHEFAYGGITEPTVNPWNPSCLVGGSSGGPAAALAAGLAPLAIGTDTAGSIRIPANLCGVVGLKPTNGLVSAAGIVPLSPSLDVAGPMGHRPGDLAVAMAALAGERFTRGASAASSLRRRAASGRLRIGYLSEPGRMTPGAAAAFDTALQLVDQLGRTSPVEFVGFEQLVHINFTILGVEAAVAHDEWGYPRELYTPYVRERLEQAAATRAVDYERARRSVPRHRATLDRLLDDCDALVLPGIPYPAPKFGVTTVDIGGVREDRDTSMCRNMGFANVTGHPVLALPILLEDGRPVGVQLVGRRGGDAELLALGEVLSRRTTVPTVAPAYAD